MTTADARHREGTPPSRRRPGTTWRALAARAGLPPHAALAACLALALLPLAQTATPPLFDYPNHLARMHVLARWDEFGGLGFFERGDFLVPNVLSDLIGMGLMALLEPLEAGRALLALTLGALLTGAFALNAAAAGRASPWPAVLALPLLYNEMLFWGFLNYLLGLGVLLWGAAAWLGLERGAPSPGRRAAQLALGAAFALAAFFAHMVAFGLFTVAIAWIELHRAWGRRAEGPARTLGRLAASAGVFAPALLLYLLGSPSRELGLGMAFDFDPFLKLSPFTRALSSGNPWADAAALFGIAATLVALAAARGLRAEPRLAGLAAVFAALVLVLPYTAMGSFFLDARVAVAAALVGAAAVRGPARGPARRRGPGAAAALVAALALGGARTAAIAADWSEADRSYAALIEAFETIPRGAMVVPAEAARFQFAEGWLQTRTNAPPYEHAASYAAITRDAVVTNLFARRGQNPLVHEPGSEAEARLAMNPIRRVVEDGDLSALVADARAVAEAGGPAFDPGRVHLVAFRRTCGDWPSGQPVQALACGPDFSVVSVLGEPFFEAGDVAEDSGPPRAERQDR
jgi:hypothetical protein